VRFLPPDVESHIVCERKENIEQFGLPNVHSLSEAPRKRLLRPGGVRDYRDFLIKLSGQYGIRILHSHFGNIGWANMEAAGKAGLRHVVTFYGRDVNLLPAQDPLWHVRYRELFEQAYRVLCEGPHMARCVAALGCPEEKIQLHHLGVELEKLPFKPRSIKPGEPLRVLVAASFREKKGIPYAIDALGRLKKDVNVEVTIIGDAPPEESNHAEKRKILAAIEKNGLSPRMPGYRPHDVMIEEAYRHHVFLSPSVTANDGDTEGGAPVTIIEMAATGMPVVSTTHCDIPHVLPHGLLAGERDVEGLLGHMMWLMDNPGRWQGISEAGRRHIEINFSARLQGEKLAEIYREIVK
jgi:colanic acid/amylovoran biosynthesis glycosyltransferase